MIVAAELAFKIKLRKKVEWISSDNCWALNLEIHIRDINAILGAGLELGVAGNCRLLTEDETARILATIKPFKTLGMEKEIREELIRVLTVAGVDTKNF